MQHEVPLYSRSIAIETGTIYLTGGYFKAMNMYLKSCYRYDELFGHPYPLPKSDMVAIPEFAAGTMDDPAAHMVIN